MGTLVVKRLSKCKHISFCDKRSNETPEPILTSTELSVIYQLTMIKVNGIKSRTLLNTSSGSSYSPQAIFHLLKINLTRKYYKNY